MAAAGGLGRLHAALQLQHLPWAGIQLECDKALGSACPPSCINGTRFCAAVMVLAVQILTNTESRPTVIWGPCR